MDMENSPPKHTGKLHEAIMAFDAYNILKEDYAIW